MLAEVCGAVVDSVNGRWLKLANLNLLVCMTVTNDHTRCYENVKYLIHLKPHL